MGSKYNFYADIMSTNQGVTGSCNSVVVRFPNGEKVRFLVDCGLYQEKEYLKKNEELPFNIDEVEFVLVTHVHVDHVGRLPYMVKKGYCRPIYATEDTCKLLPLALGDSCKVLRQNARRNNTRPLYDENDVSRTISLAEMVEFNVTLEINERIKVTFVQNGHLIGAACIVVQISYPGEEDINLFFTGDYHKENIFFAVSDIPNWILDLPLTLIQEATYGNTDSDSIKKNKCFEKNVLKFIERKGTIVIPVFSLGRAQEILYHVKKFQEEGKLSKKIPIYLDGKLSIRYTSMYKEGKLKIDPDMYDFLPENLHLVEKSTRSGVLYSNQTKIIICSSGMGSYGPAQTYIPEYISRKNALIQFTGYTSKGTMGERVKAAKKNEFVEAGGIYARKIADVEYTTEFSAHAKADELLNFLLQFKKLKLVLINHGDTNSKNLYAKKVVKNVHTKKTGVLGENYIYRVGAYGFIKTLMNNI